MTRHQHALRGLSKAFFDSDLVATRLMLFIGELCWAIMLWWPGDTFSRPTYGHMGALAPEFVWAAAFTITAAIQLHIVAFELQELPMSKSFAIWNAALWVTAVGMMIASVYPPPAGIGAEIAAALAASWIAIRPAFLAMIDRKIHRKARAYHAG